MDVQQIAVSALKPWEENPRINDHAVEAVVKSISAFGFNVPILCDQNACVLRSDHQAMGDDDAREGRTRAPEAPAGTMSGLVVRRAVERR
jgi:hypothetical protein